ncbi:hypothetical protein IIA79_04065 [bacterium]|nr:hypothetical protein [bacterium]
MENAAGLERFHPLMLYSILGAVRRFEHDFYLHLCRAYHLDAERILGLFTEIEHIGPGQLGSILAELREHNSYHDIVYLAGRNTLSSWCDMQGVKLGRAQGGASRFNTLTKQLLTPFLGIAVFSTMVRGEMHFIEVSDSIFARGVEHLHPVCGFYAGFLSEIASGCIAGSTAVNESSCKAADQDVQSCLFQVPL